MAFDPVPIRKGDPIRARPINDAMYATARLCRLSGAGAVAVSWSRGTPIVSVDLPRRMTARVSAVVGSGVYTCQPNAGSGSTPFWVDLPVPTVAAREFNDSTAVAVDSVVELVWVGECAEWRFQSDTCP